MDPSHLETLLRAVRGVPSVYEASRHVPGKREGAARQSSAG